jgi:cytoskeletal protein CcmA (bactofilin family)
MWKSSDKKVDFAKPTESIQCLIGSRMSITGDISFSGGLMIEGAVKGTIVSESGDSLLIISERGSVDGEVRAPHVELDGQVTGDIVASERIKLGSSARVRGNLYYKLLEMAAGAQVNGQMVHEDEPRKSLPKPSDS